MAPSIYSSRQHPDGLQKSPACLPGLEHVNRYWDKTHQCFAAKILPGEYYVSMHNELITTVLGSCIAACIRDVKMGIGGMNHFMLPMGCEVEHLGKTHLTSATRYGNFAMEILINEIIKAGGDRKRMEVKLFGGGRVLSSMSTMDIGKRILHLSTIIYSRKAWKLFPKMWVIFIRARSISTLKAAVYA